RGIEDVVVRVVPHEGFAVPVSLRVDRRAALAQQLVFLEERNDDRHDGHGVPLPWSGHRTQRGRPPAFDQVPSMIFRFCTAAPLAPLPRLSSRAISTACAWSMLA